MFLGIFIGSLFTQQICHSRGFQLSSHVIVLSKLFSYLFSKSLDMNDDGCILASTNFSGAGEEFQRHYTHERGEQGVDMPNMFYISTL